LAKAIMIERVGEIAFREIKDDDVYQPTQEEEELHGTKVVARQTGDPGPDEVEVEAILGAVCTHEVSLFNGDLTHPRYPMVPGHEAVHRVVRTGRDVSHVKAGDYVSCCWYMGQWSKKVIGPAKTAFRLPDPIGDPAGWIIEPAASVVNAVTYMDIKPGMNVLLIGTGFMGLLLLQLIKGYPLASLVAADLKHSSLELAHQCGASGTVLVEKGSAFPYPQGHFDSVIECTGTQDGLDLAVEMCGMAGSIFLFGWHRQPRRIDLKLGHLRGQRLVHTSPAIDDGNPYERFWPKTIDLFERGVFDLSMLISHKYRAEEIERCMEDSSRRLEGFVKSVFYL